MSIEQALAALTAAVEANTAALKGGASAGKSETKTETKGYTAKHTKEEMLAAMNEVKEKIDAATAKGIRDDVGKVAKLAELTDPATIDAVYDAAKAALKKAEDDV
jgi:hypothetical protein